MPRVYKPRSNLTQYKLNVLNDAISSVKDRQLSINKASEKYGIKRTTLQNRVNGTHNKKQGGQCALHQDDEIRLQNMLLTVSHWGFPMSKLDLRHATKAYLDKCNKNISNFKDNFPGDDWAESFLSRHGLKTKKSQNIAPTRAAVTVEVMTKYFENLENTVKNIPPENIFNYDETNFTDDPGSRKLIFRRGVKYPENVMAHSKTSTSVMFCGSATGELLPIYVVYRAQNVYDTWIQNGPPGARYNATSHGWFESLTFVDWFRTIFVPYARTLAGPKVLIGDNLSTHFSEEVINVAKTENILFICLPSNCTHIVQPLDVAFFAPLKRLWRKILTAYKLKKSKEKVVPKESFPVLMAELWNGLLKENKGRENLISGFRACGIVPCDKTPVIKKLDKSETPGVEANQALNDTVLRYLKNLREPEQSNKRAKKRKVTTEPGHSISIDDFVQNESNISKKKILQQRVPLAPNRMTPKSKKTKQMCKGSKCESSAPKQSEIIPKKERPTSQNKTNVSSNVRTRSTVKKKKL